MKILLLVASFTLSTLLSFAQTGTYVKYNCEIIGKTDEAALTVMMMEGSFMEIALSESRAYSKSAMGSVMTTELEFITKTNVLTMYMSGMMGRMAARDNVDAMDEGEEKAEVSALVFSQETKLIQGYICKKAIQKNDLGTSIYWYTEAIKRPGEITQMPDELPGLALEISVDDESTTITYKASEVRVNTDISMHKLVIPEDVQIQSFKDIQNMGDGM